MELTGNITDFSIDYITGKAKITVAVNENQAAMSGYDELHNEEKLSIKITKFRKKRSLDANAYFWVLCGKLASKTQQNKTDIYRTLIREIGDNYEILPIKDEAVEKFCQVWQQNGLGYICDIVGASKLKGYTNVCAYYGSSTYNSKQMNDLIASILFECEEQGIQTETPDEIANMLNLWATERG